MERSKALYLFADFTRKPCLHGSLGDASFSFPLLPLTLSVFNCGGPEGEHPALCRGCAPSPTLLLPEPRFNSTRGGRNPPNRHGCTHGPASHPSTAPWGCQTAAGPQAQALWHKPHGTSPATGRAPLCSSSSPQKPKSAQDGSEARFRGAGRTRHG